jgi:hypothetical protein
MIVPVSDLFHGQKCRAVLDQPQRRSAPDGSGKTLHGEEPGGRFGIRTAGHRDAGRPLTLAVDVQ